MGDLQGLTKKDMYAYNRYIADRRLLQLGLKPNFKVKENPLPWLEWVLNGQTKKKYFKISKMSHLWKSRR